MNIQKVIFIDTETTGVDFVNDEIIQCSGIIVDLDTKEVEGSINYFFESTKEVPARITEINGYYKGKWEAEGYYPIDRKTGAEYILKFITLPNSAIFCHNSAFDRSFVAAFLTRFGGYNPLELPKYWFDDATLAALFVMKSDWQTITLDFCKTKLGVEYQRLKKHDSLDDCYLLKEVFFEFMKRIHVDRVA